MFLVSALLFLVIAIGGLALAAAWSPRRAWAQAAAVLTLTILLVLYAVSEDDYRKGGISRWEAYDAKGFTVFAVTVGIVATVGLVAGALAERSRLCLVAALVSSAAATLQMMATVTLTVN